MRREVVQAGSVEGAGLDVCDPPPLYVLMEKDSALPTASTQMQERPWPDATRLAETGRVAILNGCGGVTCNRDTSSTLARFQEAES